MEEAEKDTEGAEEEDRGARGGRGRGRGSTTRREGCRCARRTDGKLKEKDSEDEVAVEEHAEEEAKKK